ncbi:MAG: CvpA family protein [Rickettsiales bacterium]|jgi:membrane protein required for colicin V production|nr:CvpA family protein [Rickettsiales bacterium]
MDLFTFLDFVFLTVVAVSAICAYGGGFIAEAFGVAAWIGTAVIAKYAYPHVEPKFAGWFGTTNMISAISAYVSIFVVVVMLLSYLNKKFARKLRDTNFHGVDKSLGFFFGLIRGVLIMALMYVAVLWFMPRPKERPEWITGARSKPVLKTSALFISKLLPAGGTFGEIRDLIDSDMSASEEEVFERLTKPAVAGGAVDSAENGYRASEIRALERQLKQLDELEADLRTPAGKAVDSAVELKEKIRDILE